MKGEQQDMETTAEQLIREKSYDALSSEELAVVQELCDSEEEFQNMKQFFGELEHVTRIHQPAVSASIKESLDSVFSAKHPGIRANWTAPAVAEVSQQQTNVVPIYQRKWARIAAIFLIAAGTIPIWLTITEKEELIKVGSVQTAKNELPKEAAGSSKNNVNSSVSSEDNAINTQSVSKEVLPNDVSLDEDLTEYINDEKIVADSWEQPVEPPSGTDENSSFPVVSGRFEAVSSTSFSGVTNSKPIRNGQGFTSSSPGMLADLNPEFRSRFQLNFVTDSPLSASMDEQSDELFDLLVPAF